ncbi:MAG: transcriptional repressor LexA [Spirochaetaceae bacterium]|nr:MAG: transcriptional repressor LexA [Spirochaetaceae bacterium]
MKDLTPRQREVLEYIELFIQENKYPPTMREISGHFGISAKGAYDHVKALQKKGRLSLAGNRSRTIEVLEASGAHVAKGHETQAVAVPILGNVAAGKPLLAEENYEGSIAVPASLVRGRSCFALHVRGDSMNGAGIHEGDIAVVASQSTANNGDIVVAMVDEAVTLKRFYLEKNRVQLRAENPAYPPIYTQNLRILGKLAHLIRSYE